MAGSGSERLNDRDIVLYALHLLDGWHQRVHTEDIALKCFELAPSRFSWVKYPRYPDVTPARYALEDLQKPRYGALVRGESERKRSLASVGGWMLTAAGTQWLGANTARIEHHLGKHIPVGDRLAVDRKLKQLLRSAAFREYATHGERAEISHAQLAESLICTVNTGAETLRDRLDQLYSAGERLGREDVKGYVAFCREKLSSLLRKKGEENA